MRIVVTGGTGTVGSHVVKELAGKGHQIAVLTRDPAKARGLPDGVQTIEGDLQAPQTVRTAFRDADAVFLLNAVSQTEASEALMAVTAMRDMRVKRVVYLSVQHAERAAWLPHFGSKVGIEEGLKRSGLAFTILRPSNFYQNDAWFKDVILQHGVYPQPLGSVGVSRVDVRDIAEAAAIALTTGSHEGKTYDLVGPEPLTGEGTARAWSEVLKKDVRYGGDDLEAWEQQSLQYLPDWMVFDFKAMYAHFQTDGLAGSAQDVDRVAGLLGHPPRSYQAFVRETAQAWGAV